MLIRPISGSAREHVEDMHYLIAHLRSSPDTSEFVAIVEPALASLRAQMEAWKLQADVLVQSQAELVRVDEELDNTLRSAVAVLLEDVNHAHRSPKLLTFLPRGMTPIIRASYLDKLAIILAISRRCAQDRSPTVQALSVVLSAAAGRVTAALARRQGSVVDEMAAFGDLQLHKLNAMNACRKVAHRLAELYPGEPARVRSCFRPQPRASRSANRQPDEKRAAGSSLLPETPENAA